MKLIPALMSALLCFLVPALGEPLPIQDTDVVVDEELFLAEEESDDAFDDEILALEEELKKDAESFDAAEVVETDPLSSAELLDSDLFEDNILAESGENRDAPQEAVGVARSATLESEDAPAILPVNFSVPEEEEAVESFSAKAAEENTAGSVAEELPATVNAVKQAEKPATISVDLQQAFSGAPIIYTILSMMSVGAIAIWLYSLLTLYKHGSLPNTLLKNLQNKLNSNQFEDAISLCTTHENIFSKMVASGITTRRHGLPMMIEAMKAEGKRVSVPFWQRIGLLNDIAIIAPMIGLLGTVLGMFYAFYDVNRSMESISTLFDGLGISVGTTVAGLVVAILALILHSTIKFRLVKTLAVVENEAQVFATLIDDRSSVSRNK